MRTLGYALMGLLARARLSGYDLAQRMKVPLGFFWHARHSQIYPELARLQAEGLVQHEVVEQTDRPDKKVYELTEAGRELLKAWAAEPQPLPVIRDELILKAYSIWLADPKQAAVLFREQARLHAERLAEYDRIREELEEEHRYELRRLDSPLFATYAVLVRGIGYEREYGEWCGWLADRIESALARL